MKITQLQCPACGGQLTINEKNPMIAVCKYCNTHVALEWENNKPYLNQPISYKTSEAPKNNSNSHNKKQTFGAFLSIMVFSLVFYIFTIIQKEQQNYNNVSSSVEEITITTSDKEKISLSGNLGELASSIFGLPAEELTETELSKIQWLEIEYEITQKKIGYSFDLPDAENAQLNWVSFSRDSDLGEECLSCFTGLKKLRINNSLKKEDIQGLHLESISGYFHSPNEIANLVEDVSTIKELQFLGGLDTLEGIEQFSNLETLYIGSSELNEVDALRNLPNLKNLKLDGFDMLSDFSIFSTMNEIVEFSLASENLKSLHFLTGMTNLNFLEIADAKILSLDGIETCSKLEMLSVSSCDELQNMNAVTALTNLKELSLDLPYACQEPDLSKLTTLERLKLSHFENCSFLTNMKQLQCLEFDSCYFSKLPDLSQLTALKELTYHSFAGKGLHVDFISKIPALEKLDMGGLSTYDDISEIFNMKNLKELHINGMECEIDFNQIKDNQTLESLSMNGVTLYTNVQVSKDGAFTYANWDDVMLNDHTEFLEHFKTLKHLSIQSNKLTHISFTANMPMLETIDLTDNYITEIRPLAELKNLKQVICTGNPISNINVLSDNIDLIFE